MFWIRRRSRRQGTRGVDRQSRLPRGASARDLSRVRTRKYSARSSEGNQPASRQRPFPRGKDARAPRRSRATASKTTRLNPLRRFTTPATFYRKNKIYEKKPEGTAFRDVLNRARFRTSLDNSLNVLERGVRFNNPVTSHVDATPQPRSNPTRRQRSFL